MQPELEPTSFRSIVFSTVRGEADKAATRTHHVLDEALLTDPINPLLTSFRISLWDRSDFAGIEMCGIDCLDLDGFQKLRL